MNSPYRETGEENILYSSFTNPPKRLDPAVSYNSNEYAFIGQIYEPPFQYHYLKRPYRLVPLTAKNIPRPVYYNKAGKVIRGKLKDKDIAEALYKIEIKRGVMFQNHPAFAKDNKGKFLYHDLGSKDVKNIYELKDFEKSSTRELTANDYVYQIKRMADPSRHCPIYGVLASYIKGFSEYSAKLKAELEKIRADRKKEAGASYNREWDELKKPIVLDLNKYELTGVRVIDRYTYSISLKVKYPQFIYWMAMPFFAPVPSEADAFYGQGVLLDRQITLDTYPVGTGPYRMAENKPSRRIILVRNENYHTEYYPSDGTEEAKKLGLLEDAGKKLPFINKAIYTMEKENIPYWNKFLQGYYDTSGISSDSFDQAIKTTDGNTGLSDKLKKKNIRLIKSAQTVIYYTGFNMLDDVIGGYSEKRQKLRQAVSIAINTEEYIQIFRNGRGIAAQSPIPPGIFGHIEGKEGINPYVFTWDNGEAKRKPISEAKRLLEEAGYPGGKDPKTGKALMLHFDTASTGPDAKFYLDWLRKQFKKIGIQLVVRATDYNRFQDKILKGDSQIFEWGWNADYPDPENFFFLLYGPNKKVAGSGENAANYENQEFDRLFVRMANMENSPQRLKIIKDMLRIVRKDAPWIWGFNPISFGLYHSWYKNAYPNLMANNTLKYKKVDSKLRTRKRAEWNKPIVWPIYIFGLVVFIIALPVVVRCLKRY